MNCRYYRIWIQRRWFWIRNTNYNSLLDTDHAQHSMQCSFVDATLSSRMNERTSERVRAVRTLFTLCTSVNMLIIPKTNGSHTLTQPSVNKFTVTNSFWFDFGIWCDWRMRSGFDTYRIHAEVVNDEKWKRNGRKINRKDKQDVDFRLI